MKSHRSTSPSPKTHSTPTSPQPQPRPNLTPTPPQPNPNSTSPYPAHPTLPHPIPSRPTSPCPTPHRLSPAPPGHPITIHARTSISEQTPEVGTRINSLLQTTSLISIPPAWNAAFVILLETHVVGTCRASSRVGASMSAIGPSPAAR